jgi:hypothetical protein
MGIHGNGVVNSDASLFPLLKREEPRENGGVSVSTSVAHYGTMTVPTDRPTDPTKPIRDQNPNADEGRQLLTNHNDNNASCEITF